ncbi:TPA: hypothetical protein RSW75_000289 [Vibrio cholerae]|uniref:hypothetical protein n=1 Tax=Vibrio cholerae TaxID=666 RepID=UPI0010722FEC|nr:hypothetical protein [Vibrio cholerae]EGR0411735.1 hypothetical protein [Vibrio cholerae]EHE0023336.1 hypothetical protein [Vibrio cholerae]EJK2105189.1 hypothetical protein [Vibrio cholerae]EJL6376751.1 hypothetical protein [Vibrio cholerae]EJP6368014.1 hypothetical protein [Vibrio cholerae]
MRRVCISLLMLLSVSVYSESTSVSQASFQPNLEQKGNIKTIAAELDSIKVHLAERANVAAQALGEVETRTLEQNEKLNQRLDSLEMKLETLGENLDSLKTKGVNDSLGMNFSVWTGILLASVSAIVTTLGVVIAIGSVFGYKKIMDSSRQEAERVAKEEANQVAKEEVAERITRGEFNALVIEAVDRVAFGNINSNSELDDDRGGTE